jgi:hypothetical protein
MSLNQLLLPNPKAWLNENVYNLASDGRVLDARTAVAINVTGAITAANVVSGIITSSTAAAVTATFANGQAAALYALMNAMGSGGQVQSSLDFLVVNSGGTNAFTLASSDSNLVIFDSSATVAAHSSRLYKVVITNASTPVITIY